MSDRTADRLAILETLARYAWALSDRDWDRWEAAFAPGGTADFSGAGGSNGSAAEGRAWLETTFAMFELAISQSTNAVVEFDGDDAADVRSGFRMVMKIGGETPTFLEAQGWYSDRFVRVGEDWLIAARRETLAYVR